MKQNLIQLARCAVVAAVLFFASVVPSAVAASAASEVSPQMQSIEIRVPCLTVRDGQSTGQLSYLPLTVTRRGDSAPLRVMLVDDTPNGSGRSFHSSIWQAAMTAALLRSDTMHGLTIAVEFSGYVDGPSAGGVTCLAILSALEGLPLPTDFAMTGTILPDGTIGSVGGIPAKMRAAAAGGVKRLFVPSFVRIVPEETVDEKGEKVTSEVDIQHLADELCVELIYVDNILDAYAELHHRPRAPRSHVNIRQRFRLPKALEQVLTKNYTAYRAEVQEQLKAHPDFRPEYDSSDFSQSPRWAEGLYQEGRLSAATLQMIRCWLMWRACGQGDSFYEAFKPKKPDWSRITFLREYHLRKQIAEFMADIDAEEKRLTEAEAAADGGAEKSADEAPIDLTPQSTEHTEICAQLEMVDLTLAARGKLVYAYGSRLSPEALSKAPIGVLERAWDNEGDILQYLYLFYQDSAEMDALLQELGDAMPKTKALASAAEVERLFYSVGVTVQEVAAENYNEYEAYANSAAAASGEAPVSRTSVLDAIYDTAAELAECLHSSLKPGEVEKLHDPAYQLQCSLKFQVARVAWATAMVVIYGADDSNDFLPHLLRSAREAAIQNLDQCIGAGVPCIAPIYEFEYAEALSGTSRQREALVAYWRASLYAKALQMSFPGTEK